MFRAVHASSEHRCSRARNWPPLLQLCTHMCTLEYRVDSTARVRCTCALYPEVADWQYRSPMQYPDIGYDIHSTGPTSIGSTGNGRRLPMYRSRVPTEFCEYVAIVATFERVGRPMQFPTERVSEKWRENFDLLSGATHARALVYCFSRKPSEKSMTRIMISKFPPYIF